MVGVIAGSAGWIVVVRPSLLQAALLLICAPSAVLVVVAIAILAAPKEWRKAMLAKTRLCPAERALPIWRERDFGMLMWVDALNDRGRLKISFFARFRCSTAGFVCPA